MSVRDRYSLSEKLKKVSLSLYSLTINTLLMTFSNIQNNTLSITWLKRISSEAHVIFLVFCKLVVHAHVCVRACIFTIKEQSSSLQTQPLEKKKYHSLGKFKMICIWNRMWPGSLEFFTQDFAILISFLQTFFAIHLPYIRYHKTCPEVIMDTSTNTVCTVEVCFICFV